MKRHLDRIEVRLRHQPQHPFLAVVSSIASGDMEGVVAKQASGGHKPDATTWVKIKNREYSQAVVHEDFVDRRSRD
jgi:hypothetical protein